MTSWLRRLRGARNAPFPRGGFTTAAFTARGAFEGLGSRLFVLLCMAIMVLTVCLVALGVFEVPLPIVVTLGLTLFVAMVMLQSHAEMRRDLRLLKNHALQLSDYESEINRRVDYIASVVERSGGAQPDELAKRLRAFNRELVVLTQRLEEVEAGAGKESGPEGGEAMALPRASDPAVRFSPSTPAPNRIRSSNPVPSGPLPSFAVTRTVKPSANPSKSRNDRIQSVETGPVVEATRMTGSDDPAFVDPAYVSAEKSLAAEDASPHDEVDAGSPFERSGDSARGPVNLVAGPAVALSTSRLDDRDAAAFRIAVSGRRLAFHLLPILSLPDRQPSAYRAIVRLKPEQDGGDWIEHEDLLARAETYGLTSLLERKTLYNGARMLRSVLEMGKRMRLVCPLSARSLADDRAFEEVALFLETNEALRADLVLEIGQAQFRGLSAAARQRIGLVAEAGFELGLGDVRTRDLDAKSLRGLGFTQITAPVSFFGGEDTGGMVLSLAAHRIACIATGVSGEDDLLRLTEHDVALAQGSLLAPPRAVKADLLRPGVVRRVETNESDGNMQAAAG